MLMRKKMFLFCALLMGAAAAVAQPSGGDRFEGLTRKIGFSRMIPPHGLEITYDKTVHVIFPSPVRYVDLGSENLIAGKADGGGERNPREGREKELPRRDEHERHHGRR